MLPRFYFSPHIDISLLKNLLEFSKVWFVGIDINGEEDTKGKHAKDESAPIFYHSHVEFLGSKEPITGSQGMSIIPGFVIYTGIGMSFLEAFTHFNSMDDTRNQCAIYLEAASIVLVHSGTFHALGKDAGSAIIIKGSRGISITQIMPGESTSISKCLEVAGINSPTGV